MDHEIGEKFQQESKHCRESINEWSAEFDTRPELYKEYSGSPLIQLPTDVEFSALSLDKALKVRKSVRHFSNTPLTLEQLSYLVWSASGVQRIEHDFAFRTAPSAGGLFPIETYLVVNNVVGVSPGLYHYCITKHALETLRPGEYGIQLSDAAMGQSMCAHSSIVFIWTSIFQRTRWKYGSRAYRYIYLDAGHMAENVALTAAAMGLGTCAIAAIFDDEVNEILGVDGIEESAIYLTTVGTPATV